IEKLPRVRRQRLHIFPLPLGKDRVKGQRGFPGAGETSDNDELIARNVDVDAFEIVLVRAANADEFSRGWVFTSIHDEFTFSTSAETGHCTATVRARKPAASDTMAGRGGGRMRVVGIIVTATLLTAQISRATVEI